MCRSPGSHTPHSTTGTKKFVFHHSKLFSLQNAKMDHPRGRTELVAWVNEVLEMGGTVQRVEEMASGALYCQLVDATRPGCVPLKKVNFEARLEHEFIKNFKVLQDVLTHLRVPKVVPVERLVKGRMQDNLEFLQWLCQYCHEAGGDAGEYNAKERRMQASRRGGGGTRQQQQQQVKRRRTPARSKPRAQLQQRRLGLRPPTKINLDAIFGEEADGENADPQAPLMDRPALEQTGRAGEKAVQKEPESEAAAREEPDSDAEEEALLASYDAALAEHAGEDEGELAAELDYYRRARQALEEEISFYSTTLFGVYSFLRGAEGPEAEALLAAVEALPAGDGARVATGE